MIKTNSAESPSAVVGDTASATTTATAGDALGTAGTAGTRVFAGSAFRGAKCYQLIPSGASGQVAFTMTGFTGTDMMSATFAMKWDAIPPVATLFGMLYTSASPAVRVLITETGLPRVSDYAGASLLTGATPLVAGRWYIIQEAYKVGTSTTTGIIRVRITDTTTGEVVFSYAATNVNAGVGVTSANWQAGKLTTSTDTTSVRLDDIIVSNETYEFLPPLVNAATSPVYGETVASNTGWTVNGGGSLIDAIRDGSDGTFLLSIDGATIELKAGNLSDGPIEVFFRADKNTDAVTTIIAVLLEGTTIRASWEETLTKDSPKDFTKELTTAQNAAVVDRNNLSLRFVDPV